MEYRRVFLASFVVALVIGLTGCASTTPAADTYQAPPETIAYSTVDLRHFVDVGQPVRTHQGTLVSVEAQATDTLLWFEDVQTGRFEQAFLRRGNNIYALGREGDYRLSSAVQSAVFSIFMEQWRDAQHQYAMNR